MHDWAQAVVAEFPDAKVYRADGSVWILECLGYLGSRMMTQGLGAIWADPAWAQPWGFVLLTHGDVRYEPDLRGYGMPPEDRRSVNTAIVIEGQVHRMVITSIGIGLRIAKRHPLDAYPDIAAALAATRKHVGAARAEGRNF